MEQKKLTKADLRKVFLRSLTIMCSWNYERQMHMGFMCGMSPVLDKLYADDEERKKDAYRRHMEFFNCTPQMTPFIMGLVASMEEQNANSEEGDFQTESIPMIKTSLMGPFAGIGDSFFQGTLRIITFGIGLSFAKQGSVLGPILAVVLFAIPSLLFAYNATFLGYESGNKYLAKLYQGGPYGSCHAFRFYRRSFGCRWNGCKYGKHYYTITVPEWWYISCSAGYVKYYLP